MRNKADGNPAGRPGHAAKRRAERERIQAELLAELRRRPSAAARYAAEAFARQTVEARRLESQGKSTLEQDRLIGRLAPLLMPDIPVGTPEDFTTKLATIRAREAAE